MRVLSAGRRKMSGACVCAPSARRRARKNGAGMVVRMASRMRYGATARCTYAVLLARAITVYLLFVHAWTAAKKPRAYRKSDPRLQRRLGLHQHCDNVRVPLCRGVAVRRPSIFVGLMHVGFGLEQLRHGATTSVLCSLD